MGPMKKIHIFLVCVLLAALTACGSSGNNPAGGGNSAAGGAPDAEDGSGRIIAVSISAAQDTLDPAKATAQGS